MSWTDDRIDSLKRLWGDGLSASQIATQLGGISRNAVIGKVHRLKLESRIAKPTLEAAGREAVPEHVLPPAPPAPVPAPPRLVVAMPVAPRASAPAPSGPIAAGPIATSVVPPVAAAQNAIAAVSCTGAEIVPITRNLTLVQLSERTCKWPLGDPLSNEFRFCGNHSRDSSPYCAYHARLAFQPASERRRVR